MIDRGDPSEPATRLTILDGGFDQPLVPMSFTRRLGMNYQASMSFTVADLKNPQALDRVRVLFSQATFLRHVGISLSDVGPGWAETTLVVAPHHGQSEGFIHAGVQATMADHTAGSAAGSLVATDEGVLTVEFKVNLLRPAAGERLTCRAEVIRAGKRLMFTEARVSAWRGGASKLVATFSATIAVVSLRGEG